MLNYYKECELHINLIKSEGRYREFIDIRRISDKFPSAFHITSRKEVVLWCINDYLGMSQNSSVLSAAQSALIQNGVGAGGTRNIGGNHIYITQLEERLAQLHKKEKGLVFTSGYIANDTTLSTLIKIFPKIVFFSDELNHASIIQGIKNSGAKKYVYKHLDMQDLERKLKSVDIDCPKIIVFESVYSMDGEISPIDQISNLAKRYNALTYIDEVHSVGLYGATGAGISEEMNVSNEIDIIQGTLAKSYGTIGGYITGKNSLIDAIRSSAQGFIFTTSLPPAIAYASIASINHLANSSRERQKLYSNVREVKNKLTSAGIKFFRNNTHIIPIIIGDPILAKNISDRLLSKYQIYVQHVNFPTVPKGTERLRIIPTNAHTQDMIDNMVCALKETIDYFGIRN